MAGSNPVPPTTLPLIIYLLSWSLVNLCTRTDVDHECPNIDIIGHAVQLLEYLNRLKVKIYVNFFQYMKLNGLIDNRKSQGWKKGRH
jgi:hypothetical protein